MYPYSLDSSDISLGESTYSSPDRISDEQLTAANGSNLSIVDALAAKSILPTGVADGGEAGHFTFRLSTLQGLEMIELISRVSGVALFCLPLIAAIACLFRI
jgi:hypothetical protein